MGLQNHHNNFNALRLLGALFVFITHSFAVTGHIENDPLGHLTNNIVQLSAPGLVIFFFISGYLVTNSALQSKNIIAYLKKRALRIFPALVICVLLSVLIAGFFLTDLTARAFFMHTDTLKYLLTATTLIIRMPLPGVFESSHYHIHSFNASLWSIQLEVVLYLTVALIVLIANLFPSSKIFRTIATTIFLVCFFWMLIDPPTNASIIRNINLVMIFFWGSLVQIFRWNQKQMLMITASSLAIFFSFSIGFSTMVLPILWIGLSGMVWLIGTNEKIIVDLKTDISYGFYIYAFPIQQIIFGFNQSIVTNLLIGIPITALLGLLSWRWIEKPCLDLKGKIQ